MVKHSVKKSLIICGLCILVIAAIAFTIHYGSIGAKSDNAGVPPAGEVPPVADAPGDHDTAPGDQDTASADEDSKPNEVVNINIYSIDRMLGEIVEKYAGEHWDFPYNINHISDSIAYSTEGLVHVINDKLSEGASIDLYSVPAVYTQYYVKGEYSDYACTYEELGIDVDAALKKAEIPQYVIEDGKNADGKLVALPYFGDAQIFVYRRSIAKEVWGTDDPGKIEELTGGGTGKWDKLIEAAETLKKHGYYIMSGNYNLIDLIDTGIPDTDPEVYRNGSVTPKWNEFLELSKSMFEKGCIMNTGPLAEDWSIDPEGTGKNVFGYIMMTDAYDSRLYGHDDGDWAVCTPPFKIVSNYSTGIMVNKNSRYKELLGPLIEWITLDCSETGLQYRLASGTFRHDLEKLSVLSGTVMKNVDGSRDVFGGQNINPIVYDILQAPDGKHNDYAYGDAVLQHFLNETDAYVRGDLDKETAIRNFVKKAGLSKPVLDTSLDGDIVWKDKNFERAVRNILKKPKSSIRKSDVYGFTELNIAGNSIESLDDIVHFTNLKSLDCSSNSISDISILSTLPGLEALDLSNNQISDVSALKDLTGLQELNLSGNEITDVSSLKGLTQLKELYIIGNKINDITCLSGMTNMEIMEISSSYVSDIRVIGNMKKLTHLYLNDNKIEDISSLKGLTNLETLHISGNNVSAINVLGSLKKLKELAIDRNPVSDISVLKKLKNLETLFAEGDKIADKSPASHIKNVFW